MSKMIQLLIEFKIVCRNYIDDYYVDSEYYANPLLDFDQICDMHKIDPCEWYRNNLSKQWIELISSSFTGKDVKSVLKKEINLPLEFFDSEYIHLYVKYKNNLYEICDDQVGLLKYCSQENHVYLLPVLLVLDDQPQGVAYIEDSLRFYFHSKEMGKHHKPHVHIEYSPGGEGVMDLLTNEVLQGAFPNSKMLKKAKRILSAKREYFIEWWNTKTDGLNVDINYALGIAKFFHSKEDMHYY